MIGRALD